MYGLFANIKLYDAHPGMAGAAISLPSIVKRRVDLLEGLVMLKLEAFDCLEDAADILVRGGRFGLITTEDHGDFIAMRFFPTTRGLPHHAFRVLRYRKAS